MEHSATIPQSEATSKAFRAMLDAFDALVLSAYESSATREECKQIEDAAYELLFATNELRYSYASDHISFFDARIKYLYDLIDKHSKLD